MGALAAPVSRSSIVLGKVLGGATFAAIRGDHLARLRPLVGRVQDLLRIRAEHAGDRDDLALSRPRWFFAIAFRSMDSTQGVTPSVNMPLFPWLLSGALLRRLSP